MIRNIVLPLPLKRLLLFSCISIMASTLPSAGQDNTLVFPQASLPLARAMEMIESQTDYSFVYHTGILDMDKTVTLPAGQSKLGDIISMLEPQVGYRIIVKLNFLIVYTAEPYRVAAMNTVETSRTPDDYRRVDPSVSGITTNPRPVTEPDIVIASPEPAVSAIPEEFPYSSIIPLDLYSPVKNRLPITAVKTNLLYGAAAQTPNISVEIGLGQRHSIAFSGSQNRWKQKRPVESNDKLLHWTVGAEYRYWFCERFNGHFLGAHAFYAAYNINGKSIPLIFKKEYRYDGYAVGAGISYGYHWAFHKKWGLEFNLGVGAAYMDYDRFSCVHCDRNPEPKTKTYFGPTRAGVSLVFMIR